MKKKRALLYIVLGLLYATLTAQTQEQIKNLETQVPQESQELQTDQDAEQEVTPEALEILQLLDQKQQAEYSELDIPLTDSALIEKFRKQYTTTYGKQWLNAVMTNGRPYRAFIRSKLKEYDLPLCLEFLPVIESSFKITAVSKSGATGIWQFMKNSIAPFNIRANEWLDERRDPWISTDAALRKLKENYTALGDWYLALAAYNAGLGGVQRVIKQGGTRDYWELSERGLLKKETINYVPKFLAISDLLTNYEHYDIALPEYDQAEEDQIYFDQLLVSKSVDIHLLAELMEEKAADLSFLNPALNYTITPPGLPYHLKLPVGTAEKAQAIINDPKNKLIKYYMYTIKSGDTLYALALHYGVSVDVIERSNPGIKANSLKIGQRVLIPALKDRPAYAGKKSAENLTFSGTHVISQGDTLWSISLLYGVQVEALAEANNLQVNSILRIGTTLKVPILE